MFNPTFYKARCYRNPTQFTPSGSNARTLRDFVPMRTKMSTTTEGGTNNIPQPIVIGRTIVILKLSSTSLWSRSNIRMHASTNRVKLVMDRPKAISPIHRANSSSRVMFINSGMALCTSNGLRCQMAQRRIRYRSPRI
jgi:hypothetical protein